MTIIRPVRWQAIEKRRESRVIWLENEIKRVKAERDRLIAYELTLQSELTLREAKSHG